MSESASRSSFVDVTSTAAPSGASSQRDNWEEKVILVMYVTIGQAVRTVNPLYR